MLMAAGITGIYLFTSKDKVAPTVNTVISQDVNKDQTAGGAESAQNASPTSTSSYKDGTYSAAVVYTVPRGYQNSITANVTVSNNKITSVSVDNKYTDRESGLFIDNFEAALEQVVIGEPIGSLSVSRIGGATITTDAFEKVITKIAETAKS